MGLLSIYSMYLMSTVLVNIPIGLLCRQLSCYINGLQVWWPDEDDGTLVTMFVLASVPVTRGVSTSEELWVPSCNFAGV